MKNREIKRRGAKEEENEDSVQQQVSMIRGTYTHTHTHTHTQGETKQCIEKINKQEKTMKNNMNRKS